MARHRSGTKKSPPDVGLYMQCVEEDLEQSQIMHYTKADKEFRDIQAKLDNYIKQLKAEIIESGENCLVLQLSVTSPAVTVGCQGQISQDVRQSAQGNHNYQQVVNQGILTRSTPNSPRNTYLVMDSGLSFMVGQIPTPEQTNANVNSKSMGTGRSKNCMGLGPVVVSSRGKNGSKKQMANSSESEIFNSTTRTREKSRNHLPIQQNQQAQIFSQTIHEQQTFSRGNAIDISGKFKVKANAKQWPAPLASPAESNAIGGLLTASHFPLNSNSDDGSSSKSIVDSREVTLSKIGGKTFPSLVVVARPNLKTKNIPQVKVAKERTALDAKVKGVLMYTASKFTEWLIQQGLIKSEQTCPTHLNNDFSSVKLKLGMYSDVSKFPYSGGYVWISECCPSQFVSVFSGSIFEASPHPPATLLKLIYHWACQTNVQNVVQWVKVDNLYVKNFFTNMRAVCTQAIHEKFKKMGGLKRKIEVGVISLGTTSQDGNKRQVKVEVLGVLDHENKLIRLRAVEPHSDERSFKKKFVRILQPLEEWVSKDSTILTDFTVNKAALNSMGFNSVFQDTSDIKYSNQNIMEYLRKIVPRMFQNTLSLLSRQIIQQFLDELVWREVWGPIPSQAFVNIISHMAEQTKLDVSDTVMDRLNKVASNPFKRWTYSVWNNVNNNQSHTQVPHVTRAQSPEIGGTVGLDQKNRSRKRGAEQALADVVVSGIPPKKLSKIGAKDKYNKGTRNFESSCGNQSEEIVKFINEGKEISLEKYYYGNYRSTKTEYQSSDFSGKFNVKCCVCNKRFLDNIVLMKHINLHCQIEPILRVNLKNVHQCENCFLGFNSSDALKTHLEEVHFIVNKRLTSGSLCHICEQRFTCHDDLVIHMHKTHVQLEMPYECGVCHFRTSVYRFFVEHFLQSHNREGHLFCPYCLKVITVWHEGSPINLNMLFYVSHLEKHQRLSLVIDCDRCQLSFIHKGILDQHLEADHGSWKDEKGTEPIAELSTGLVMPRPEVLTKSDQEVKQNKPTRAKYSYTVNKFASLRIDGLDEDSTCIECEEFLYGKEHFTGTFNCTKCSYATCCERAMSEHLVIFHEAGHPQYTMGNSTILPGEMFCVCGYSTRSGNRMAKHLVMCERKCAYSNADFLTPNNQSYPVESGDIENLKGQDMLNMLGLVRKSPDVTSIVEDCQEVVNIKETLQPDEEQEETHKDESEWRIEKVKNGIDESKRDENLPIEPVIRQLEPNSVGFPGDDLSSEKKESTGVEKSKDLLSEIVPETVIGERELHDQVNSKGGVGNDSIDNYDKLDEANTVPVYSEKMEK